MLKIYQRHFLFFLTTCLLILSVVLRIQQENFNAADLRLVAYFLTAHFILTMLQPVTTTARQKLFLYVYTAIQILLVFLLMMVTEKPFDYFAVLFLPMCYKIWLDFPKKTAFGWIGFVFFCILAGMVESYGWLRGLGFASTYIVVAVFIVALGIATNRAEQAHMESQALLAELQTANQKLQAYTLQVEELAAAQERNRLARELHDSATQTVFSMVLTAQSARILIERDPARAAGLMDHLQELAQNALAEMRTLIQHLRPRSIAEEGLASALRKHFAGRQLQDGLSVDFQLEGERRLPADAEEALFRVVQEALNNVCKHSGISQAIVRLHLNNPVSVSIEDHGCGFDPQLAQQSSRHLGLASMSERVQALGGTLVIDSKPGQGTCIRVENLEFEKG
jgi:signal transduction histidine kinase